MKKMWRGAALAALGLMSGGATAESLDINLHGEALRVIYGHAVGRGLEMEVGHYFNEKDQTVTNAGLHVGGENWSKAGVFDIDLGGRAVLIRARPLDVSAIAVGAQVRFSPIHRLGIGGNFYHAPSIITFMDGETYTESGVTLDYQLLPQGLVYVGYRRIAFDAKNGGEAVLDDRAHVGMKLLF